ncbi:MAG: flagellar basal body L-ring protein FlgH [Gammaproteobacteria bacterium]|jgi:flagellar L-ring protein precursor FlgH|nr:flagellar basal body L-ring protein FlgH [Gammaproteobacteria bacterium]
MRRVLPMLFTLLAAALAAGCASTPKHASGISEDIIRHAEPAQPATAGAIYRVGLSAPLFEDIRPRRVGDIITVMLVERTNASKSASTSTSKDNSVDIANPTLFGNPLSFGVGPLGSNPRTLENNLESSKTFDGTGESAQSNQLTGNITAVVTEVLPNGYLRIYGEKVISINQGDEHITLSGIVRPADILADNTISSTLIAGAEISYGGTGVVADTSDMGWLGKFFNGKWWPF